MKYMGWNILFFTIFNEQYNSLVQEVDNLRNKDPQGYKQHPKTKLLKSVHNACFYDVPQDPKDPDFRLGKTLGEKHRHWKRVKRGLPRRHRLFFQFMSRDENIIYAWLNDDSALRKEGDKHDVYKVFKSLVEANKIPDQYQDLLEGAVQK